MTAFSLKKTCLIVMGLALLLVARTAAAQTSCVNDVDCPTAACGGDICDWADTAHPMTCKAAGTHPKGHDGWCTVDTDCKCNGMGATCDKSVFSCTFTRPCDAPGAAGCGAGGSGGGGSGGGGTTGNDGGGNTSGGGSGGGGCSVAGTDVSIGWPALALVIGLTFTRRRRRR
jgi:hypothetical protein